MPVKNYSQDFLFPDYDSQPVRDHTASTFADNLKLPVHRWFRYSAGLSAQWVEAVIAARQRSGPVHVLDPFAGAGMTLVAAERMGAPACGTEG